MKLVLKRYHSEQKALCLHHRYFDQAKKGCNNLRVKTGYKEMNSEHVFGNGYYQHVFQIIFNEISHDVHVDRICTFGSLVIDV